MGASATSRRPRKSASFARQTLRLAALAAACPFALLGGLILRVPQAASMTVILAVASAAAVTAVFLAALGRRLSRVSEAVQAARACAEMAGADARPDRADEVDVLTSDLALISTKLETVRHRLANRHPVTGVATREPFFIAIAQDLRGPLKSATLGVVRLAQYERLAAVDKAGADAALRAFAERLAESLGARPLAQVDRDCFAVWFCDLTGPKGASDALKTLAATLAQPPEAGSAAPDVRIGAAIYPNDGDDGAILLGKATAALGRTSRAPAERLAFFSDESSAAAQARFSLEQALREAVNHRELTLHYQPVIDLSGSRVVGAEALLRWRHPEFGPMPPGQFIPILEQSGLIEEVGRQILDAACAAARDFESLGLPGFKVGVNLSPRQFRDEGLTSTVADALRRADLKPQRLELEITEAALMADLDHTRRVFKQLGALGVSIAIDDFGAGASSLGDLKGLPFGKLKIDRAFVTDVGRLHDSQAVCAALIELGRRLDIAVLAEGVETREEADALRVLGCSLFQGFFFSRPLTAEKFKRKVTDPDWLALLASPVHRQRQDIGVRLLG